MRSELQAVLDSVRKMTAEELPELIGQLESVKAAAWARLTAPTTAPQHDELIGVAAAAQRLGVSMDYLYEHAKEYPCARRQGRKLLFSSLGIDQYIKRGPR